MTELPMMVVVFVVVGLVVVLGLAWQLDLFPTAGLPRSGAPAPRVDDGGGAPFAPDPAEAERWERIQTLFLAAIDRPPEDRAAFLLRSSEGNEDVIAQVRRLVGAHEADGPLESLQQRVMDPLRGATRPVSDLVGETVLHFELLETLGAGGMGVVYRAEDTRLGRPVALKFLSGHLLADPDAKRRFVLEAKAAAAMDHPNLCTIHEVGETPEGHLYIAMAYYEGESVKRRIARGPMSVAEALDIGAQVARGLSCAAEHDVVHRDIKPANLILTTDGTIKIVDFGLAKIGAGHLTQSGALMGTVSYMSPEQTRGETVDQRTDIWSLGVVLYEMLAGRRPFRGGSDPALIHSILNEEPEPLDKLVAGLNPAVVAVVSRALCKDPKRRYADAASLLRDLERLLADPDRRGDLEALPALPPEGERRLVVVMACSITGFEDLLDEWEPEAVDAELARTRARIRSVVEDYGGLLNDFTEDQAVALFGVPVTHEDDALRAARAVLEISDSTGGSPNPSTGRRGDTAALTLRFALNSSQVPVRATTDDDRPYRVGGTVVRDAFLLAAAAAPGELLIAPHLRRAIDAYMEVEDRDPLTLSPDAPPVTPGAVLGGSVGGSWLDATTPTVVSGFVGRDAEIDTLQRALTSAVGGSGQIVSVVGDAGVGKSRLLHEFRALLANDGVRYAQGRCRLHGGLTPLVPLVECVRSVLGLGQGGIDLPEDQVIERIRRLAPEVEVYLPILLHVLSVTSQEHGLPGYMTDEELRRASAEALISVFTLGSGGRPLVVFLEDWHWADGASRDVLEQLREMVASYPLLVVVTSRPEESSGQSLPTAHVPIHLAPLAVEDAVRIMRSVFHGARISRTLADYTIARAGGNPFFIEELCHTLMEAGVVHVEAGTASIVASLDEVEVPRTVQAVLRTRLDRLDPEAREVLRYASVIGRDFESTLLRRVVPSPGRMHGALDVLRRSGLVQRVGLLPSPTFRFKHALTLDVTYGSLLERQRRERHAQVGHAIEQEHPDRLDDFTDALARHFALAEKWTKAVHYGLTAVERAAALWRFQEAVDVSERTRRCMERLPDPELPGPGAMIRLLLDQERFLERLGHRDRQQAVIDELLRIVPEGASPERAQVLVRQGDLLTLMGRWDEALDAFASALSDAEACGAREARAHALRGMGLRAWRMGRYEEALAPLTELVEESRRGTDPRGLVRDLLNLGRAHRELGNWDEAWALAEEAEVAEPEGTPIGWGYVANFKGHLLRAQGRLEEAVEAFDESNRIQDEAGLGMLAPIRQSMALMGAAAAEVEIGRIDDALRHYAEALELARRGNRVDHLGHALMITGDVLMRLERVSEAIPLYEEAVSTLCRLPPDHALSQAMGSLALAFEAVGDDEAPRIWREARVLRVSLGDRLGALQAAEREAGLVKDPEIDPLLDEALTLARDAADVVAEARIRNRMAVRAWQRADLTSAADHYRSAAEALRPRGPSSELGIVLNGWGAVLTRLSRCGEARDVLEEALEIHESTHDDARKADAFAALGATHRESGDLAAAAHAYRACVDLRRTSNDRAGEGWALARLAEVVAAQDEGTSIESPRDLVARALDIGQDVGDTDLQALCSRLALDPPASIKTDLHTRS